MLFSKDQKELLLVPEGKEGAAILPDTTEAVPVGAFSQSARLSSVVVGEGCANYSSENGILYSKDRITLVACAPGFGGSVVIPKSVEALGLEAFKGCGLTSLVVLGTVATIDPMAFDELSTKVAVIALMPGSGYDARKAVWESAGFSHFEEPADPGDIQAPAPEVSGFAFELLPDWTLSVSWQGIEDPDPDLIIPAFAELNGITYRVSQIAESAFERRAVLRCVTIPSSVTSIGKFAFANCPALTSVTLNEGLTSIGDSAFETTALEDLFLPASITSIGDRTFADCAGLIRIVAFSDIPSVSEAAISGCSGLSVFTPYREDGFYPWVPGVFALANHIVPYGLSLPEERLELEVGQGAALFEGGICEVPEGGELSYSYPASCVSVDAGGMITAKAAGTVEVVIILSFDGVETMRASRSVLIVNPQAEVLDLSYPRSIPFSFAMPVSNVQLLSGGENVGLRAVVPESALLFTLLSNGTYSVAAVNKSTISGDLVIPDTYNGKAVTEIAEKGFYYASSLTSVQFPSALRIIGSNAFFYCSKLSGSLNIPNTVTTIGEYAFSGCKKLTGSLIIPSSLSSIEKSAFSDCSGFAGSLVIPNTVTAIKESAFSSCKGFTGILSIPNSIKTIGARAFAYCSGFTGSLTIPDSITAIEDNTFLACIGFNGTLSIPATATSIGNSAFETCSNLSGSLILPKNLTSIGSSAFSRCSKLSGPLAFPDSVTSLGSSAFNGCSSLTGSLVTPASVVSLESSVFEGCSGFTGSLTISKSVSSIGVGAFKGCTGLTGSLVFPLSVDSVGVNAFYGCSGFTGSLTIPDMVTFIGASAFFNCSGLNGSLVISSSITAVADSTFFGCSGLTGSLEIPGSVASIGSSAFSGCYGFSGALVIPDSVDTVGSAAFYGCSGFTGSLSISRSLTSIKDRTFDGCSGLTGSLEIPGSVSSIEATAFRGCSGFTGSITIAASIASVGEAAFRGCASIEKVTWLSAAPISIDRATGGVFEACTKLTSFEMGATVTAIKKRAFANCDSLAYIICRGALEEIVSDAFTDTAKTSAVVDLTKGTDRTIWTKSGFSKFNNYVSFLANGGAPVPDDQRIITGSAAAKPADPVRSGYRLEGWYKEAELTNEWIFVSPISSDTTLYAKWRNTLTVTFDGNGGTPASASKTVDYNTLVTAPTNPTRAGYTFKGWWTATAGGAQFNPSITVTANATYYAQWDLNSYTVTLHPNNGGADIKQQVNHGSLATAPTGVTKQGHTFSSWCTDSGLTQSYNFSTAVTANKELWAKWTPIPYAISFESNGGSSVNSYSANYGTKLAASASVKAGYVLEGWYKEAALTTMWDFVNATVAGDTKLYAKWTPNSYTITFDGNGATGGSTAQIPMTYGTAQNLTANGFSKTGYAFAGWAETPTGAKKYDNSASVKDLTSTLGGTVTLYAVWTVSAYAVSFVPNGGSAVATYNADYGTKLNAPVCTRQGYTLEGWYKEAALATKWEFTNSTVAGITVLYAKWTPNAYAVHFDSNDGTGTMTDQLGIVYGVATTLKANTFTKEGHRFTGWSSTPTGAVVCGDGGQVTSLVASGIATLYAQWAPNSYNVAFSLDGGTGITTPVQVQYGSLVTNPGTPGKPGYLFGGWYKDAAKTVVWNFATDTAGTATTIYAKWGATSYSVRFDSNGGAGALMQDQTFTYDAAKKMLTKNTFTKQGYTFAGWSKTQGGAKDFNDQEAVDNLVYSGTVTLYAVWTVNSYTISFEPSGGSSVASYKADYGTKISSPASTKEGNTLEGWYSDVGLATKWDFASATVAGDTKLYAKWMPNSYTVAYDAAGGSAVASVQGVFGKTVTQPTTTRAGYTCSGWYSVDLDRLWNFSADTVPAKAFTLAARWTGNPYTVAFTASGADAGLAPAKVDASYGVTLDLPRAGDLTRKGHSFAGWNTKADGTGKAFTAGQTSVLDIPENGASAVTLFAQWTEHRYAIEFNPNSGKHPVEGDMDKMKIAYSQSVTLAPNAYHASDGYTFAFWTTDAAGMGARFNDRAEVSRLASEVFDNDVVQLYAQWQGGPYEVTYDVNATDAEGTLAPSAFRYGVWETLAEGGFARPNHRLIGWSSDKARADAGVAQYALGGQVKDLPEGADSIVLYAVWIEQINVTSPLNPTVQVDAQGKPTVAAATFFESKTSKPVKVTAATCSPIAGDAGTVLVFPNTSQWGDIAVTLASASASGSPNRLFLTGLTTPLANLTIPAKSSVDSVKLPVSVGLAFLGDVDIAYSADASVPVAQLVFTFEMGA